MAETQFDALENISLWRRLWLLFFIFARIAAFVVGGGYVILPMVEQELVARRKWLKSQEFVDMTAVVQTIPGIIAGNCAIYLGYRIAGKLGALAALLGVAMPSVIIITLVAMFFNSFSDTILTNSYLNGAFVGVKAAVCGLVLATAVKMIKKTFTGAFEVTIGVCSFVSVVFFPVNPGVAMVTAAVLGVGYLLLKNKLTGGCK